MCQECSTPGRHAIAQAATDHLGWQTACWPAVRVDQASLARQGLAVLDHAHHVMRASPDARAVHDDKLARVAEDLADVGPQPTRSGALMVASSDFTNAVMAIAE